MESASNGESYEGAEDEDEDTDNGAANNEMNDSRNKS